MNSVIITYSFQLWGMDFIESLFVIIVGNTHILNLICYFSRFDILFVIKVINVEHVIWCLKLAFIIYRKPYAIYCDKNYYFFNNELKEFLRLKKSISFTIYLKLSKAREWSKHLIKFSRLYCVKISFKSIWNKIVVFLS